MTPIELDHTDPLDPAIVESPWVYYQALREQGGLYRVPARGFFLVPRYDTAMHVIKNTETFSSKSGVAVPSQPGGLHPANRSEVRTLLTADPPEHRKYRELVNKAFSLKRITAWAPWIRDVANGLIDQIVEKGSCELVQDFAVPLPLTVICRALDLPLDLLPQFKRWSDTISHLGGMLTPEQMADVQAERRAFGAWVVEIVEDRRSHLRDDFISDLIRAEFDGKRPLDTRELASIVTQFLVAGNETTTNTISSGMMLLLQNPLQLERVRAGAGLVPNLVEEVLRMESPVQNHFRVTTCPTQLEGIEIPEGVGVGLMYGSCNRDEQKFPNAERFDVGRENAARHLAFGQGIHFCPGAPLARLELCIAFELLLTRLPGLCLNDALNDYRHLPSFTHRALKSLHLSFESKAGV